MVGAYLMLLQLDCCIFVFSYNSAIPENFSLINFSLHVLTLG